HYVGWRSLLFMDLILADRDRLEGKPFWLFGVFAGKSTIEWARLCKQHDFQAAEFICFDSFQGIPKETAEHAPDIWDPDRSTFFKGFNASEFFETDDVNQTIKLFKERVEPHMPCPLGIYPGFFSNSLTSQLANALQAPGVVVIDTDIYTSAKQALDWMAKHDKLIPGMLIGYDDWGGSPKWRSMGDGESRAHREITEEYGLTWELAGEWDNGQQKVF